MKQKFLTRRWIADRAIFAIVFARALTKPPSSCGQRQEKRLTIALLSKVSWIIFRNYAIQFVYYSYYCIFIHLLCLLFSVSMCISNKAFFFHNYLFCSNTTRVLSRSHFCIFLRFSLSVLFSFSLSVGRVVRFSCYFSPYCLNMLYTARLFAFTRPESFFGWFINYNLHCWHFLGFSVIFR